MDTLTAVDITRALAVPDLRWPSEDELRWLAVQAQSHSRIVEVGCYLGRSTRAMADNTNGIVWAVDDFRGPRDVPDPDPESITQRFLDNVSGSSGRVRIVKADHADVPPDVGFDSDAPPDMVFIDGDHGYEAARRDILRWKSVLASGATDGLLCGHDSNWPGVLRAISELLPDWRPGAGSIWEWKESYAMPTGLRKMSISDLKLNGTANDLPGSGINTSAQPPTKPILSSRLEDLQWTPIDTGAESGQKIGLGIMLPTVTRNGDGSLRYSPPEWGISLALLAPLCNCRHMFLNIQNMQRDLCRTALIKQARAYGAKYGVFIDDDVVVPPDGLQKLQYQLENADDDVALCAGIYTSKSDPACPLVFQDHGIGPYWRWRKGDVFECRAIATGIMMIRLDIFDRLPEPWFVDVHGVEQAKQLGLLGTSGTMPLSTEWTDDMFFCKRVRDAGYRMLAHGGVICDHWGQDGKPYRLATDSYPMKGR